MQQKDRTAPPFLMEIHFPFAALSLSRSLSPPQAILTKLFHLSPSTQSVSICTANIKSRRRDSNKKIHTVLERLGLDSVVLSTQCFVFFCHMANGVQWLGPCMQRLTGRKED